MVKALVCGIVVSEFEFHSRYYVHFLDEYPCERYETPLSSRLWVKQYHKCSCRRMGLALNKLKSWYDIKKTKQTKRHRRQGVAAILCLQHFGINQFLYLSTWIHLFFTLSYQQLNSRADWTLLRNWPCVTHTRTHTHAHMEKNFNKVIYLVNLVWHKAGSMRHPGRT